MRDGPESHHAGISARICFAETNLTSSSSGILSVMTVVSPFRKLFPVSVIHLSAGLLFDGRSLGEIELSVGWGGNPAGTIRSGKSSEFETSFSRTATCQF